MTSLILWKCQSLRGLHCTVLPQWSTCPWSLCFEKKEKNSLADFLISSPTRGTRHSCELWSEQLDRICAYRYSDLAASGNIFSFDVSKSSAHGPSEAFDDRYDKISKVGKLVMLFLKHIRLNFECAEYDLCVPVWEGGSPWWPPRQGRLWRGRPLRWRSAPASPGRPPQRRPAPTEKDA